MTSPALFPAGRTVYVANRSATLSGFDVDFRNSYNRVFSIDSQSGVVSAFSADR